jgi:alpha-tubulin suppressor-like RCC1 family protein
MKSKSKQNIYYLIVFFIVAAACESPIPLINDREQRTYSNLKFKSISAGAMHTCALTKDNIPYCWGDNKYGQLGLDSKAKFSNTPAQVKIPSGIAFRQIFAGGAYTCALSNTDVPYCWGSNESGQLGTGNDQDAAVHTAVIMPAGVPGFQTLALGNDHTCALSQDGIPYCWGENGYYALGMGGDEHDESTREDRNIPSAVALPAGVTGFKTIAAGDYHSCALTETGRIYCWGSNNGSMLGVNSALAHSNVPVSLTEVAKISFSQITAGGHHSCALSENGAAYCWGTNDYGQLGMGEGIAVKHVPDLVSLSSVTLKTIDGRGSQVCALSSAGLPYCWGDSILSNGSAKYTPTAIKMPDGITFEQITSRAHACAITPSGDGYCWGSNVQGQLGIGKGNRGYNEFEENPTKI